VVPNAGEDLRIAGPWFKVAHLLRVTAKHMPLMDAFIQGDTDAHEQHEYVPVKSNQSDG